MRSHRLACTFALVLLPSAALAVPLYVPRIDLSKEHLPLCGLAPSRLHPNLCVVKYRITTGSRECQAFFDQGLGYFYSYVWMEAARSFETAARFDPDCPMAWWGLSRALERYGRGNPNAALKKAQQRLSRASHRENLLITARLQEKGLIAGVGNPDARRLAAIKTLDTLLALYDDDEEGWYYRAQLAGGSGLFGGQVSSVPFYRALLRVNPLHPGANHELVHFYENFRRPALGWIYAENYIKSSPGIPHAFHMQAHLATRLGRWDKTSDRSSRAVELERAYHKEMNVQPQDDPQYTHHLETLMRSLTHDGRFREGRQLKKECEDLKFYQHQTWFRLHLAERHWDEALKMAAHFRKTDKVTAAYLTALVYLHKADPDRAAPEVAVLQEAYQQSRSNKELQNRLWETLGLLQCQQGHADAGLKLLAKTVARTKDDYGHHAWGNGAYYMEIWGIAALRSGRFDVAEEAFLEALAHDAGCFHAALGLQVLCEYQGRGEEARRYDELAQRCWRHADPSDIVTEYLVLHEPYGSTTGRNVTDPYARVLAALCIVRSEEPAQAVCHSGLQIGQRPGPYAALVSTGPLRGQSHCFVCETEDRPAVIVFARSLSEPLGKLAHELDQALDQHKKAELRAWITFLSNDQTSLDPKVVQWGQKHATGNVPLGVFEDQGGPPSYRIAREAEVTILLSVRQRVVANFAFRTGELTDERVREVLRTLPQILAGRK